MYTVKQIIIHSTQVNHSEGSLHAVQIVDTENRDETLNADSIRVSQGHFNTWALSSGYLHFVFKIEAFYTLTHKPNANIEMSGQWNY